LGSTSRFDLQQSLCCIPHGGCQRRPLKAKHLLNLAHIQPWQGHGTRLVIVITNSVGYIQLGGLSQDIGESIEDDRVADKEAFVRSTLRRESQYLQFREVTDVNLNVMSADPSTHYRSRKHHSEEG